MLKWNPKCWYKIPNADMKSQMLVWNSKCWYEVPNAGTKPQMLVWNPKCWYKTPNAGMKSYLLVQNPNCWYKIQMPVQNPKCWYKTPKYWYKISNSDTKPQMLEQIPNGGTILQNAFTKPKTLYCLIRVSSCSWNCGSQNGNRGGFSHPCFECLSCCSRAKSWLIFPPRTVTLRWACTSYTPYSDVWLPAIALRRSLPPSVGWLSWVFCCLIFSVLRKCLNCEELSGGFLTILQWMSHVF